MKNVIILGAGRTGSSFLAGLIAHNRYYINAEKIYSRRAYPDGDYENPDLVDLNKRILIDSGYGYTHVDAEKAVNIDKIRNLAQSACIDVYEHFLNKCKENQPWLWKDPRLCYTMYFWDFILNKNNIQFIKITRDPYLVFRSHSKYRIKYSKNSIINAYHAQNEAVDKYLMNKNIKLFTVDYFELKHKSIINKINYFLNTKIQDSDYDAIKKNNISKKESNAKFFLRYMFGIGKINVQKCLQNNKL